MRKLVTIGCLTAHTLILTGCGGSGTSNNLLGQTEVKQSEAKNPEVDSQCTQGEQCATPLVEEDGSSLGSEVAWSPITMPLVTWPEGTYVARTENEWNATWELRTSFVTPPQDKPIIDFKSSMVVGISLGMWPNGCHHLQILRVVEKSDVLEVNYRHVQPSAGDICTHSFVPVVGFATIPSSTKEVRFISTNN